MRFSQIVLAASSAALSQAVFISNDAFTGLTVGVSFDVTFKDSVGPTQLYEATGTGNDVTGQKLVGTAPAGTTDIPWTPTTGGTDITLVIVDEGAGPTPTNYVGPLTVTGPTASSSSSTTASSGSSTKSGSSSTTTTGSITTTVVPVNTTILIHSSTKVYTMNGTTSATSSAKTTTATSQTTGSGLTTIQTQVPSSSAAGIASPLAFVFLALAALVTLN